MLSPANASPLTPHDAGRTRGQCRSLRLHCEGLSPSTPCRSPGAHWVRFVMRAPARTSNFSQNTKRTHSVPSARAAPFARQQGDTHHLRLLLSVVLRPRSGGSAAFTHPVHNSLWPLGTRSVKQDQVGGEHQLAFARSEIVSRRVVGMLVPDLVTEQRGILPHTSNQWPRPTPLE